MAVQIGERAGADFSDPLQLLSDCHRRIEHFLGILRQVAAVRAGGHLDREHREAMAAALKYFREAAPKHTADEEESLFPRLERQLTEHDRAIAGQIRRLGSEHLAVRAHHDHVDRLAALWLRKDGLPTRELKEFERHLATLTTIYASHIHLEDAQLFPAAERLLTDGQLAEIGGEMALRRGLPAPQTA